MNSKNYFNWSFIFLIFTPFMFGLINIIVAIKLIRARNKDAKTLWIVVILFFGIIYLTGGLELLHYF